MAFLVASRAREIGIRMALGADTRHVRRLVLRSSASVVVAGAALGVAGAFIASRYVQSQLFGVSPADPLTIIAVTAGVMLAALVASWRPAVQAGRVDPRALLDN